MMRASLGRRSFLFGRASTPSARAGEACLERHGVVCRACGDTCDRGAIAFLPLGGGTAKPVVDTARCDACGRCVPVCPAAAMSVEAPR